MQVLDSGTDWVGGGGGSTGTGGPKGGGGGGYDGGGSPQWADATTPETGNLQILLGEGRMEGLVDGLKSVYLDNTPILASDGVTYNFKGLAAALVAGTNTQPSIKGITGTESETSVNVQVTAASPVTRSVTSNPSAVRVRVSVPALRVVSTTDGKESAHSVTVKIERQNASWNGGAWEEYPLFNTGVIVGGPFSTKFTQSYRIDTPAPGTWQIRVTRVSADDADAYHQSQTWWDALTEIVDARLRYPNRSIFSLRVNAKQFRAIPQVNLHMKGVRVQVPTNYTPASYNWTTKTWTAASYATTGPGTSGGAWDGTFKTVFTDNPAWVFLDAATNVRYGAGSFLTVSGLDKWQLYAISQWCDAMVSDGKGGTEPRMTCNLYMQQAQNAIKALGQLASIFWGVIYYASGLVIPVPDSDTAPVALFTNANVEGGRFNYEGTARSARHTAAIASFINPDLGYAQDAAVYEDEDGIARYGYNRLDLQAIGATSQGQALRLAKWTILTELMASEVVGFVSGLEGSTVKPGDVVQIADQFKAGAARMGGRIVSTATTTVIPLDAPVTLGAGTYTLRCQTSTGMESRTVTTAAGTVSSLTVSPAFSSAPAIGSGWLLQAGTTASLWRVLSVKKAEGIKFEIAALKHDPAKYAALGLAAGDVVTRTPRNIAAPAPTGLAISSTTRILNDRQQLTLKGNWNLDGAVGYIAQASRDYGPWEAMTVSGASAYLDGIQPGSWRVRVSGDWRDAGVSTWSTASATISATSTPPNWVAYADSLARNPNNLIKNADSEDPNATGYEAAGVVNVGAAAHTGSNVRRLVTTTINGYYIARNIRVNPGDQLLLTCKAKTSYSGTTASIQLFFRDASGTDVGHPYTSVAGAGLVSAYGDVTLRSGAAPAGTVAVDVWIESSLAAFGETIYFDSFYLGKMVGASLLEADIALLGVVRSPNFTLGTSSAGPAGFQLSGPAFTTTYIGGATDANCHFELEGNANFGGYKVLTVTDRVQPVNRIVNGYFYTDLNGWSASGANPPTYSASSKTAGTGSATLTFVGGFGYTKTGNLTQSFSLPKTFPGQTISLAYQTGYSGNGANAGTDTCTILVYILNQTTGTETLLATHSYSNANVALAWTSRSVDITSYVNAGGQFSIRFAMTLNDTHLAGGFTNSLFVDEVSIIA